MSVLHLFAYTYLLFCFIVLQPSVQFLPFLTRFLFRTRNKQHFSEKLRMNLTTTYDEALVPSLFHNQVLPTKFALQPANDDGLKL